LLVSFVLLVQDIPLFERDNIPMISGLGTPVDSLDLYSCAGLFFLRERRPFTSPCLSGIQRLSQISRCGIGDAITSTNCEPLRVFPVKSSGLLDSGSGHAKYLLSVDTVLNFRPEIDL